MSLLELESFVKKYQHLWKSGVDAHLHVETCAGQAWAQQQVHLGQAPVLYHQPGKTLLLKRRTVPLDNVVVPDV